MLERTDAVPWPAVRCDQPEVISEVFGAEAVVVNLRTGSYFAFDADATLVWQGLLAGEPPAAVAERAARAWGCPPADADGCVRDLLARLAALQLVTLDADPGAPPGTGARALAVEVFEDLQDMLLVDPIHDLDLDGDGWPVVRP